MNMGWPCSHESHAALFSHSRMPSQPSLNTSDELLHSPTVGNAVGHEDRLLLNNALNAFPSYQKNELLEALSSMLNVLEQNHGISKDVVDVQGLNDFIKADLHAPPCFFCCC